MLFRYLITTVAIVAVAGLAISAAQQTQQPANPPNHCEEIASAAVEKADQILSRADTKYPYPLAVAYNNACVELKEALGITTGIYHCDAEITGALEEWVTKFKASMMRYNGLAKTAFSCSTRS